MKILLLCTDAYGGHGGIALFNRELCAALAGRAEVIVVPRVIPNPVRDVPPHVTFLAEAARGTIAYLRAIGHARRRHADLVICGHMNLLPVASPLARHPLLITHGIEAWQRPNNPFNARLVHRARGVVSVSAVTRDRFLAWSDYEGPTFVLPNAIHAERYGVRRRREDLAARYGLEGKRVLLTVGRLDEAERSKGFDEVIELLPQLPDDVVYLIAGGGNDRARLEAKAAQLGVASRVAFTGIFDEADKPDLYSLADVYVMPSRGEGFGFVFLEALASGLPVIGSKIDGGREALLEGRIGTLVDPDNRAELHAAVVELLARTERRVPPELAHFSFENFAQRVNAIIAAVMPAWP
jgi:phosphatidyl-myo-inositol dimannoside synthase